MYVGDCNKCIYGFKCPCGKSLNSASCLTISKKGKPKQTNADRIHSMSYEELAEFIEQVSTDSMETISFGTKEYKEVWEHKETALKWLQSDVENQR